MLSTPTRTPAQLDLADIHHLCHQPDGPANAELAAIATSWSTLAGTHGGDTLRHLRATIDRLAVLLDDKRQRIETATHDEFQSVVATPGASWHSLAEAHARRADLRTLELILGLNGVNVDIVRHLELTPLTSMSDRPLLPCELGTVRVACYRGSADGIRRRATIALSQTSAGTAELPQVLANHVDLDARKVSLPGGTHARPRVVRVPDDWTAAQLRAAIDNPDRHRVEERRKRPAPLAYYHGRSDPAGAAAQAAASTLIRAILDDARLLAAPDILPRSVRHTSGRLEYLRTGSIEAAAAVLGKTSKRWLQDTYDLATFEGRSPTAGTLGGLEGAAAPVPTPLQRGSAGIRHLYLVKNS